MYTITRVELVGAVAVPVVVAVSSCAEEGWEQIKSITTNHLPNSEGDKLYAAFSKARSVAVPRRVEIADMTLFVQFIG